MINPEEILQGRYRVVRQLGEGGFGQTYEVDDGGTLKVLKILKLGGFNHPESKQKVVSLFQREAEVLSQLHHPGIPRVEPGSYFIFRPKGSIEPLHCLVMERIDGKNLEEWLLDNQATSHHQAIVWLIQLVEILAQVHQQQYLHRDIKPANIMLRSDGKQLTLIDFGAVRQVSATYLVKIGCRREGTQIISSGYTPPEQADGAALPQSDFFALGRTFVHLLTGKHPLDLRHPQTGELSWRDSVTTVCEPLAGLLDDLMALSPGQRPQNTQVILERLKAIQVAGTTGLVVIGENSASVSSSRQEELDKLKPESSLVNWFLSIEVKIGLAGLLLLLGFIGFRSASPEVAIALNDKGREYYSSEDLDNAKRYFVLATWLNTKYFAAYYNWGVVCEDQKDFNCASAKYEVAMQGDFAKAFNNRGRLFIILNQDCKAATPLLLKGLKLAKDDELQSALQENLGKCRK